MAKYTELFSEWLEEGGQLPALFEEIEGFSDLFTMTYADREIGFETPELFALKLEAAAQLHIPDYVTRIAELEKAISRLDSPTKTRKRSGGISREYGDQTAANTDYPASGTTTEQTEITGFYSPNSVSTRKGYTDKETYDDIKDEETGATVLEALTVLEKEDPLLKNLKAELLTKFENLFMQVY